MCNGKLINITVNVKNIVEDISGFVVAICMTQEYLEEWSLICSKDEKCMAILTSAALPFLPEHPRPCAALLCSTFYSSYFVLLHVRRIVFSKRLSFGVLPALHYESQLLSNFKIDM